VLYLTTAVFFAYLYRLIAQVVPGAFSGLAFRTGEHGALSPFLYFSLTLLTTVGLGDIAPVDAFACNLTMFEALLGQLFPATILARILTLSQTSADAQSKHLILLSEIDASEDRLDQRKWAAFVLSVRKGDEVRVSA
jgi:hypothetical protein